MRPAPYSPLVQRAIAALRDEGWENQDIFALFAELYEKGLAMAHTPVEVIAEQLRA